MRSDMVKDSRAIPIAEWSIQHFLYARNGTFFKNQKKNWIKQKKHSPIERDGRKSRRTGYRYLNNQSIKSNCPFTHNLAALGAVIIARHQYHHQQQQQQHERWGVKAKKFSGSSIIIISRFLIIIKLCL